MIKAFLLGWLTFCAGFCAYTFIQILLDGSVTYTEPNLAILIMELVSACVITVGGVIYLLTNLRQ